MFNDSFEAVSRVQGKADKSEIEQQNSVETTVSGYVVGVDIGGTNLRVALADMTGVIVARWSSSTIDSRSADLVIGLIRNGVESLLQQTSVPRSAIRAIAAGAPGITDTDAGVVIATSYLLGWRDVPLQSLLEAAFGVPAAVDNDVNLAALGESWVGIAKGTRDFVFLAIGTGIGAGIVLNGRLFRGMGWSAGEIGYMLVPGVSEELSESGQPGALESLIGGEGVKAQWQRLWHKDNTALPEEQTATEIFDGALLGDPLARTVLRQSAQLLSYAIYNLSLVLNCRLFVLGGGVGMHPALCNATRDVLNGWGARAQIHLTRSALGSDSQLVGAIRLALDAANHGVGLSDDLAVNKKLEARPTV